MAIATPQTQNILSKTSQNEGLANAYNQTKRTIKLSATPEATALHLNHDMLPASWQKGWSEGMSSRFKK